MASVGWNCQWIMLIEYLPQGKTINSARYCETKKLRRVIDSEQEDKHADKRSLRRVIDSEQEDKHADKRSLPAARQCQIAHGQHHDGTARLI
ncbi:Transposase, type 1 [Popillia japonica]|uniref:Transposase, type 1 n=1 Tax=Popillia japonica TaxID=7064 RepID=A0AAW1ME85_POPJA